MTFKAKYIGETKPMDNLGFVHGKIYTLTSEIVRDTVVKAFNKRDCIKLKDTEYGRSIYYTNLENLLHDWRIMSNSDKYKVITLCGSTRFKDEFMRIERELAKQNYIVINLGLFSKSDPVNPNEKLPTKEEHIDVHYQKIDMCDAVFVVNVNNYVGNSTLREIEYAVSAGKKVFYLSEYSDVIIPEEAWR